MGERATSGRVCTAAPSTPPTGSSFLWARPYEEERKSSWIILGNGRSSALALAREDARCHSHVLQKHLCGTSGLPQLSSCFSAPLLLPLLLMLPCLLQLLGFRASFRVLLLLGVSCYCLYRVRWPPLFVLTLALLLINIAEIPLLFFEPWVCFLFLLSFFEEFICFTCTFF